MFRIKICGVRTISDLDAVARSGADAIGLNFFPPSLRFVDPTYQSTIELSKNAASFGLMRVGVFVNRTPQQIERLAQQVELDAVQLHGDEPAESAATWSGLGLPIIRAIKLPRNELAPEEIESLCEPWISVGCHPLFDAEVGGSHGGLGHSLDWNSLGSWSKRNSQQAFSLAGGLHPKNVAMAINATGTRSVDTASGAEEPRGTKSRKKIADFVSACRKTPNW